MLARRDLEEIRDFYDSRDPNYSADLARAFFARFGLLAVLNHLGHPQEEHGKGLRSSLVKDYYVFYRVIRGDAQIVRVVHQKRDLRAIFGKRSK